MSRYFHDEHEHQTTPFDQRHEEEGELGIASQPSFDVVAAPPPPMTPGFVPSQAAQDAAQFVQSPHAYQYAVPSHFAQGQPAQNFTAYCNPMHNQPVQSQPQQFQLVPWNPMPNFMVSLADLYDWLHIPDVLHPDLQHILEVRSETVPAPQRACAEQLARSHVFLEWLRSPESSQLLVHANYRKSSPISGLSIFCFYLRKVLASRPDRFIPLVFFCGLHTDEDDDDDEESRDSTAGIQSVPSRWLSIGAHGLIRSFIHQLLAWYSLHCPAVWITVSALEKHAIEQNDLGALYEMFKRLVRMLPSSITVCCLVDGAMYYERDELAYNMRGVMLPLSEISDSGPGITPRPIKVLITSPTNVPDAREWVAEGPTLSLTELGRPGLVSDEEGLERMLASALG